MRKTMVLPFEIVLGKDGITDKWFFLGLEPWTGRTKTLHGWFRENHLNDAVLSKILTCVTPWCRYCNLSVTDAMLSLVTKDAERTRVSEWLTQQAATNLVDSLG